MIRPKKYNFTEALQRLRRYCAYQERCHQELKKKLWDWGFDAEDSGRVISQLIEEGFLNEERYAKAIAGGKFRVKGWGKRKITESLKQKGISSAYLLKTAMKEITEEDYENKLLQLLQKKRDSLKAETPPVRRQKLVRYGLGKGYEQELIWRLVNRLEGEDDAA